MTGNQRNRTVARGALRGAQQAMVRAIVACDPTAFVTVLRRAVLQHMVRLQECDSETAQLARLADDVLGLADRVILLKGSLRRDEMVRWQRRVLGALLETG